MSFTDDECYYFRNVMDSIAIYYIFLVNLLSLFCVLPMSHLYISSYVLVFLFFSYYYPSRFFCSSFLLFSLFRYFPILSLFRIFRRIVLFLHFRPYIMFFFQLFVIFLFFVLSQLSISNFLSFSS